MRQKNTLVAEPGIQKAVTPASTSILCPWLLLVLLLPVQQGRGQQSRHQGCSAASLCSLNDCRQRLVSTLLMAQLPSCTGVNSTSSSYARV